MESLESTLLPAEILGQLQALLERQVAGGDHHQRGRLAFHRRNLSVEQAAAVVERGASNAELIGVLREIVVRSRTC